MSSDAYLTDDDRALLEHLESEVDEEATTEEIKTHLTQLRADLRTQRAEFRKFRRRVEERLDSLEQRSQMPDQAEDQPPLYTYARLDPESREEELTTAERIAVTIHDAWVDIAWTLGGGSNYAGERNEGPHRSRYEDYSQREIQPLTATLSVKEGTRLGARPQPDLSRPEETR